MENENPNLPKQRHGCVTAWLIFMILVNSATAISYLFARDMVAQSLPWETSRTMIILLGILGLGNVIFAILLFKWLKLGFWGSLITSIGALIINLNIGLGIAQSLFGLIGIVILYGILQIKKEDISAWDNLD